jgi:sister chromatid cohesion protein DCC1
VITLDTCRIAFKGSRDEEVVLCSSNKTYLVREVETTNLIMLIEDPKGVQDQDESSVSVTALVKAHLELTLINPKLHRLDEYLKSNHVITDILSADESQMGNHRLPDGETWNSLAEEVQASEAEIAQALQGTDAVRVNGKWMGVSQEAYSNFAKFLILTITEQGWSLDNVPPVSMALELDKLGVCGQITLQLLAKLSCWDGKNNCDYSVTPVEDLDREDWKEKFTPSSTCRLNTDLLCRLIGIGLLLERELWEDKDEFMTQWKSLLPDYINPAMDMLQGECFEVVTEMLGEHGVKATRRGLQKLSASCMPCDVSRFDHLFKIKNSWSYDEIRPYITNLAAPGQTTEELLLKYARPSQAKPEDPVMYTKR